jgi:hypothetical protein
MQSSGCMCMGNDTINPHDLYHLYIPALWVVGGDRTERKAQRVASRQDGFQEGDSVRHRPEI